MDFYIISILLIVIVLMLFFAFEINIKKLKKFINIEESKLNNLTEKYPENIEICKAYLNKLDNKNVNIEENKESNTSMYIVLTNKILIANLKNSYTRIQTIAHECLHSIQPKKILLFNYFFSNCYNLYFAIATCLIAFKIIPSSQIYLIIMIVLSYVQVFVKCFLENDAMIKAKFLAKAYMEEIKVSTKKEIDLITESYSKLNDLGIRIINYDLFFKTTVKIFIMMLIIHIRGGI